MILKKMTTLENIVSLKTYPINNADFVARCHEQLQSTGSLLLPNFISKESIDTLKQEALEHASLAYYCSQSHTAYLSAVDPEFPTDHSRNRQVTSSKGCITDDQIPSDSYLRVIYNHADFRRFLCGVLSEKQLYNYDDPLSSVNVHYYQAGQELGWHFDNSSFAVTLMIQPSNEGGDFEYIAGLRDSENGNMNFDGVDEALQGKVEGKKLDIAAGTLALFRGRNSLHRVTPVIGDTDRIQVVLAYNTEPGVALSEQARLTFYGRVA
jgi:hypothetical protein